MADESKKFEIQISTPANTDGVGKTKQELAGLEAQAEKTSASVEKATNGNVRAGGLAHDFTGTGEAAATAAETAALTQKAAVESQLAVIAQTRLALTEATVAGDATLAAELRAELAVRQATLGVMRQEVLTEAELVALTERESLLLKSITAENIAAGRAQQARLPGGQAGGLLRGAGVGAGLAGAAGVGLLAGQQAYEFISKAADEELRFQQEIEKVTDAVIKQAQEWRALGKAATTDADISGLSTKTAAGIEEISKQIDGLTEKFKEQREFLNSLPEDIASGGDPYSDQRAAVDSEIQRLQALRQQQIESARGAIETAQKSKAAFDALKEGPPSEGVAHYTTELERLRTAQAAANLHTADGIKAYNSLQKEIVEAEGHLRQFTSAQERATAEAAKLDGQIKQLDFAKLSPGDQLKSLQGDLAAIAKQLEALGFSADNPASAMQALAGRTDEAANHIRSLIAQYLTLNKAVGDNTATQQKHDAAVQATLASLHAEDNILRAQIAGNDALVTKLTNAKNVHDQILALQKQGLTYEEAKNEALDQQNLKLTLQEQKEQAANAAADASGKQKHFDEAGRDVTARPFDSAGKLTQTHISDLDEVDKGDRLFDSKFQKPGGRGAADSQLPQDQSSGGAKSPQNESGGGKEGGGEAAGAAKEAGDKVSAEEQKTAAAIKEMEGKIVGGITNVSGAIANAGANIQGQLANLQGQIDALWSAI